MHTETLTFIHGDIDRIFSLACNVQNWPDLLPHYRYVDVLESNSDGSRKVVRMCAVRDNFPVSGSRFPVAWSSVQLCDPVEKRIYFKHIAGVATGMWVVWELTPDPWERGVRVVIRHSLRYPFQFLNGWFARDIVGEGFVGTIAGQTLARFKEIVETANIEREDA